MKFLAACHNAFKALMDPEGRRAWGLVLLTGGGVAMTIYAAAALYFVRLSASYAFYLGLAAHFSILVVITGFAGLLVKRTIVAEFGKDRRLEFSDQVNKAAEEVAHAAVEKAEEIKEHPDV